jgi:membrane protein DedA with SNARE-associated domain
VAKTKFSIQLITYLSGFDGWTGYSIILGVLLVCGLGVPIPEDITLVAAGILAAIGNISLPGALIAGFVGVLLGDSILFFLGRRYGYKVFTLPVFRKIFTEKRIQLARNKVVTNSRFICFSARFLPGLRAPIYLTAGVMGVKPLTFLLLDGFAALISVPIWIFVGYYLGENLDDTFHMVMKIQKYLIAIIVVLVAGYIFWLYRIKKKEAAATGETPPIPPVN